MSTMAERWRPRRFADMVGSPSVVGPDGVLPRMAAAGRPLSVLLWGPPGCGKSTAAGILAHGCGLAFEAVNGTTVTKAAIDDVVRRSYETPLLLYLDEIQFVDKRKQQLLLPVTESGNLTLVAATIDNPCHGVYPGLLSRMIVLQMSPVSAQDMLPRLRRIADAEHVIADDATLTLVARQAAGDMRHALNVLESAAACADGARVTEDVVRLVSPMASRGDFDTDGTVHYQLLAAFQKSVRGSDPDAALLYLMRLLVMASEDVGLADHDAVPHTLACVEAAERLGLPEAQKPLAQATLYLALAPKSNSVETACSRVAAALDAGLGQSVPEHIASECPTDYLYPHDWPGHWVPQRYLPDDCVGGYYVPGDNAFETQAASWWAGVRQAYGCR